MLSAKLKLSPFVIRKPEEKLGKVCFYNAKNKTFWNADLSLGSVISALDGTLTVEEVLDIVLSNNKAVNSDELKASILDAFETLYGGEFLIDVA